ncbi:MAG: hypothetical protein ABI479_11300 [Gallionella sp.]
MGSGSTNDEAARVLGTAIGQALACKMFGFGCPGQPEDPGARANYYGMSAEQKQKLIAAVKAQEAEDQATADRVKAVTEGGATGGLQLRDPDAAQGSSLSDSGISSMDFDDYRKREDERAAALNKPGRKLSRKEQSWCKLHVPLKPTGSVQKIDGQDDDRMALFKIKQTEWDRRCAVKEDIPAK